MIFLFLMTSEEGVLVLGRGHTSQVVKMHYFFKFFFSTPGHKADKLNL